MLPNEKRTLLREVISKRRSDMLSLLDTESLTPDIVETFCDLIIDEFSNTGLDSNDKPTSRGLDLERLIDMIRS